MVLEEINTSKSVVISSSNLSVWNIADDYIGMDNTQYENDKTMR